MVHIVQLNKIKNVHQVHNNSKLVIKAAQPCTVHFDGVIRDILSLPLETHHEATLSASAFFVFVNLSRN